MKIDTLGKGVVYGLVAFAALNYMGGSALALIRDAAAEKRPALVSDLRAAANFCDVSYRSTSAGSKARTALFCSGVSCRCCPTLPA